MSDDECRIVRPDHLEVQWADSRMLNGVDVCLTHGNFPSRGSDECSELRNPSYTDGVFNVERILTEHRSKYPEEWFEKDD